MQKAMAALEAQVASGRVMPVIDHVFTLDQAADAYSLSEKGGAVGKIVIRVG